MATSADPNRTQPPITPPSAGAQGAESSGYTGDTGATAGPGQTGIRSDTPENSAGHINPSSPEDPNITPGSDTVK